MNKLKRIGAALLALTLALSLAACSGGGDADDGVKIGILQYAPHASLDNCYAGILEGLQEAGYVDGENGVTIDFQNGNGDGETNNMVAANFVSGNYDVIIAIATPAAMSAYAAAKDSGIPVVFSAVSDPIAAGLVQSLEAPNSGATGTADSLNLKGQMAMIRALLPEANTIGILYTTGEPNSVSHLASFEALAPEYGFTIEAVGITDASEVASGAAALVAAGVDCVNNFTDNNVVNQLSVLLNATNEAGIPVFGSEVEQVVNGCVASESLDYVELGRTTGAIAAEILGGGDVNTIPVSVVSESTPVYSQSNCDKFGIVIPDSYSHAENVDEQ